MEFLCDFLFKQVYQISKQAYQPRKAYQLPGKAYQVRKAYQL